jgi:P27 family predicted phage terminase small subunit
MNRPGQGRPPHPAKLKILNGNPGKREIPKEIQPQQGIPDPPDRLDAIGLEAWHWAIGVMAHTGVITKAESAILEIFADTWSKYHQARELVQEHGIAIKTQNGEIKRNPLTTEMHRYRDACAKYLTELGFTPVARARIGMGSSTTEDPTEGYISA